MGLLFKQGIFYMQYSTDRIDIPQPILHQLWNTSGNKYPDELTEVEVGLCKQYQDLFSITNGQFTHECACTHACMCMHTYMHTERERERERE